MTERRDHQREGGYLLEFMPVGQSVKVSAVDPVTGTEVSIVGPASAGEHVLARTAADKLTYVLNKKKNAAGGPAKDPRGGIKV
jgi:hypothetical protein